MNITLQDEHDAWDTDLHGYLDMLEDLRREVEFNGQPSDQDILDYELNEFIRLLKIKYR